MNRNLISRLIKLIREQRLHKRWQKVVTTLAAVVVFCTTYALILPAITMTADCDMEEHTHTAACYDGVEWQCQQNADEESALHEHNDDCYDENGLPICGMADFVLHTHDESMCYDSDGNLVCTLPEITGYSRVALIYTPWADNNDYAISMADEGYEEDYYADEADGEAIVSEDGADMAEPDDSYVDDTYFDDSFDDSFNTEAEYESLVYYFYQPMGENVEPIEEYPQIDGYDLTVDEEGFEEIALPHEHDESCYDEDYQLVCGQLAVTMHEHSEDCINSEPVCGMEEHQHSEDCFSKADDGETEEPDGALTDCTCGLQEHYHEDSCYDAEGNLICGIEEHEHSSECGKKPSLMNKLPQLFAGEGMGRSFAQWIDGVTVTSNGVDINGGNVHDKDKIEVGINFKVPAGGLETENKISYQLPEQLRPSQEESGTMLDSENNVLGTYTITPDGLITIEYNETAVRANATLPLACVLEFSSVVEKGEGQEETSVKIKFNDKVEIGFTIKDERVNQEDLKVTKRAAEINAADGTIKYEIVVTSQGGTNGPITLSDIMDKIQYQEGSLSVTDKNGSPVQINPMPTQGSENFSFTLPELGKDGRYVITYMAELPEHLTSEGMQVNNKVAVDAKDKNNKDLHDEQSVDSKFEYKQLEKTGWADWNTKEIHWKITVNKMHQDISGWTLQDVMDGVEFKDEVQISPSVKVNGVETNTIKLPFTFPEGSNTEYIIEYTTTPDVSSDGHIVNNVFLQKDGKEEKADAEVWGPKYNPLEKNYVSTEELEDGKTLITWEVLIKGKIVGPWVYRDTLQGNQWFTEEQFQAIKNKIETTFAAYRPTVVGTNSENGVYKGFEITFQETLEKEHEIRFTYQSTAEVRDGQDGNHFKNIGKINDAEERPAEVTIGSKTLTIQKYDRGNNEQPGDTTHTIGQYGYDGVLKWGIKVHIPDGYAEGLVIKEKLPEGLTLLEEKNQWGGAQGLIWVDPFGTLPFSFGDSNSAFCTCWVGNKMYKITAEKEADGTIKITFPQEVVEKCQNKDIKLTIDAEIDESFKDWTVSDDGKLQTHPFENRVTLENEKHEELGSASQTQTINRENKDKIVQKSVKRPESANGSGPLNQLDYEIVINPEGKDLLEGADTLTLIDELKFEWNNGIDVFLKSDSVRVYQRNPDGTKGDELLPAEYPYTYTRGDGKYILNIQIPDSRALIVEYSYIANGPVDKDGKINNTATLQGVHEVGGSSENSFQLKITDSKGSAIFLGVTLCKVDSADYGIFLQGAKFKLYRWDQAEKDYIVVKDATGADAIYTTNQDGKIPVELTPNTAYKLEEIEAPAGYKVLEDMYEFYIFSDTKDSAGNNTWPNCMPDGFKGDKLLPGVPIYYPNEKIDTEITVVKKWKDHNGQDIESDGHDVIKFKLYKRALYENHDENNAIDFVWYACCYNNLGASAAQFHEKRNQILVGSSVTLSLKTKVDNGNQEPKVFITKNSENKCIGNMVYVGKSGDGLEYRYTLEVTADMVSDGKVIVQTNGDWQFTHEHVVSRDVTVVEPRPIEKEPLPEDALVGEYTLGQYNNWKETILSLPKKGKLEDGTPVYYIYYVKEVTTGNFTAEVTNNDITSGVITITNTLKEEHSYELPETGGRGVGGYTTVGILLMGAALVLHRRQRTARKGEC